jgi:hypothetical protein
VFLCDIMNVIYIFSFESHYLLKKSHQNPLGSYKDLSIHRDRQQEETLFYNMLYDCDLW